VVVGTAGHIDHGKSTLVQALTGIDPDRLIEEKLRGITIDLGFAHTEIAGRTFSFVDVPGHERFVHNMLAGASGIDLVLLVVSADESVMPQTREHLDICDLLGIGDGVVALTRMDVADPAIAGVAEQEAREAVRGTFLEHAPVVRVSGRTGEGLDELRGALVAASERVSRGAAGPWSRLPIDRVFAIRGFGTVVTGTLQGGEIATGDELVAIPDGPRAKVRGLQVHGRQVDRATPPCRVAVNLQGAERSELARGMILVPPGRELTTRVFDAQLHLLGSAPAELAHGQRLRVHHGTAEVLARLRVARRGVLRPGESGPVQMRLEKPLALVPGDRFIVRRYSPLVTLGGGTVTEVDPPRWRGTDTSRGRRMSAIAEASAEERWRIVALEAGERGLTASGDAVRLGLDPARAQEISRELVDRAAGEFALLAGRRLVSAAGARAVMDGIVAELERLRGADPLAPGLPQSRLRASCAPGWDADELRELLAAAAASALVQLSGDLVRLPGQGGRLDGRRTALLDRMLQRLAGSGLDAVAVDDLAGAEEVPEAEVRALLDYAARRGEAVRVGQERWIGGRAWAEVISALERRAAAGEPEIDVPEFKRMFALTRRNAIPLLERLDDEGVTRRAGNRRRIRPSGVNRNAGS
jgi:selenocysteine-specific elongation factor